MSFQLKKVQRGKQPRIVAAQKVANPRLQRTQASGTQRGIVKLTPRAVNEVIDGIVRLPNRAVPLNSVQPKKRRAGRQPS